MSSPPPTPPTSSPPPFPLNFMLLLSQKNPRYTKMKIKATKKPTRQKKIPKQSKMKLKVHKNIREFVLCWPTTLGPGVCPGVWLIYPMTVQ